MIYYFLVAGLGLLVSVYINHLKGGKLTPKPLNWSHDYLPTVVAVLILITYLIGNNEKPIDVRKCEYTAIGMKHYDEWKDFGVGVEHHEFYSGVYKDKTGVYREFEIPKGTYEYFKKLWNEKKEIKVSTDSLRDIYFLEWNKKPTDALVYTKTDLFVNYFKNSLELYNFYKVSDQIAKEEKLFTRGRIDIINSSNILEPRQSLVYGINIPDTLSREVSNVSSIDEEFRPVLLVWVDSIGKLDRNKVINHQRSYWAGGKNNEVTFCVCINNIVEKKIMWSGSFSWAINQDFENYIIQNALKEGDNLDIKKYLGSLISGYSKNYWQPRNFEMYSVLSIPITDFTIILSSILIILANIVLILKLKYIKKKERK